jgi:hypothetical protein
MDLAMDNRSASAGAVAANSQRKLVRESSGRIHEVFESGGGIFYRHSSDAGSTWQSTFRLSTVSGGAAAPCITKSGSTLLAVWQKFTGSTYDVQFVRSVFYRITAGSYTQTRKLLLVR